MSLARTVNATLPRREKLLKPTGQWNTLEIICDGRRCEVKLNGVVASTASDLEQRKGYLGLQGENGALEFRNLFLKRLEPAKGPLSLGCVVSRHGCATVARRSLVAHLCKTVVDSRPLLGKVHESAIGDTGLRAAAAAPGQAIPW